MNIGSTSGTTDYSRITGLATGMDTDGMVKQAIAGDQAKIDAVKQSQKYLEWQQEAYVDVIKDLKDFQDSYLDILGSQDKSMMISSSYNGTKASGDFSQYLEISTYPGAIKGNYEVEVNKIATSAKKSGAINSVDSAVIPSTSATNWNNSTKNIVFTIPNSKIAADGNIVSNADGETGDTTVSISLSALTGTDALTGTPTPEQVAKAFQTAIDSSPLKGMLTVTKNQDGSAKFTSLSDKNIEVTSSGYGTFSSLVGTVLTNSTSSKLSDLNITQGKVKITIDGSHDFTIDATAADMTISGFIDKLRTATNDKKESLSSFVNITYSELTKKITIENKSTGKSSSLLIEDLSDIPAGNVAEKFGIKTATITGDNAIVSIKAPGETSAITVEKGSNTFTIDNIKYSLTKETQENSPLNITIKADATDSVAKVKKFVDAYNTLIEKLNNKISEKKNYNYKPLTEAQKKEMKEDEIKTWETQAKKGLLSRDMNISSLITKLREAVYSVVDGAGISITDVGITTGTWKEKGKLKVDDEKLKASLETKGDLVQKLFTQKSTLDSEKGILEKFKDAITSSVGTDGVIIKKAGYVNSRWVSENDLSKNIERKKQQIDNLTRIMYDKENRYYRMFAALEKNMNNLNSQSNWLTSQLG